MIRLEQKYLSCAQKRLFSAARYKALNFNGIRGYPNIVPSEIRKCLPKYNGLNSKSANKHMQVFCDLMEDYEIEAEDVVMKLFVQSLKDDVRVWFSDLLVLNLFMGRSRECISRTIW